MTSPDHRRHPRLEFDGKAWCEHQNLTLYLAVTNVSAGGVFIQTGAALSTGQRLKVTMGPLTDGDEEVVARVEIVWTGKTRRGAGVGCRLVSFESGQSAYERLIARLES